MSTWEIAAETLHTNLRKDLNDLSIRQLYTQYCVASLAYYTFNESIMSDDRFDTLCKYLLDDYDPTIIHCDVDTLKSGTGSQHKGGPNTFNLFMAYRRKYL